MANYEETKKSQLKDGKMIRIIDEEGYEPRVIINNLNLRMKYYDFFIVSFDDTVGIVDCPSCQIMAKSSSMTVSSPRAFDSRDSVVFGIVRNPDSAEILYTLNFEENTLVIENGGETPAKWVSPIDLYISIKQTVFGPFYGMTKKYFDSLIEKHVVTEFKTFASNGEHTLKLVRMKEYERFLADVIKTTSN